MGLKLLQKKIVICACESKRQKFNEITTHCSLKTYKGELLQWSAKKSFFLVTLFLRKRIKKSKENLSQNSISTSLNHKVRYTLSTNILDHNYAMSLNKILKTPVSNKLRTKAKKKSCLCKYNSTEIARENELINHNRDSVPRLHLYIFIT